MKTLAHVLTTILTVPAFFSPGPALALSSYPVLPDLPGADLQGEPRIVIHLDYDEPLVEVDGQLYALGERPLELGRDELERITLIFIVPTGATLLVTENGEWTTSLASSSSAALTFDVPATAFEAGMLGSEPISFGFELTFGGQRAPTVPDVVVQPSDGDPDAS